MLGFRTAASALLPVLVSSSLNSQPSDLSICTAIPKWRPSACAQSLHPFRTSHLLSSLFRHTSTRDA